VQRPDGHSALASSRPLLTLLRARFAGLALPALLLALLLAQPALAARSDVGEMFSPAMDKTMGYSVYTPPGWGPDEQLPLVVLLHGGGSDHLSFDQYGVGGYLDSEHAAGRLPRAIILNPDGEFGFWENWYDGSRMYRDWVMRDLLPVVQERYNTASCPDQCHVMGMSMGAHGALRFIYYEADSFSTVTVISGMILSRDEVKSTLRRSIFGLIIPFKKIWGDIDDPNTAPRDLDPFVGWVENEQLRSKSLFLTWGTQDKSRMESTGTRFRETLEQSGLDFHFMRYEGKHLWRDWKGVIAEALRVQVAGRPGGDDVPGGH
jgi:enterochelin esterase-like enzyme